MVSLAFTWPKTKSWRRLKISKRHFTFSCTGKRLTRKFVGTISFYQAMILIKCTATAKKDTKEMKSGSSLNCATSGFMKLSLKSNQLLSRSFPLFCNKVFMFILKCFTIYSSMEIGCP